MGVGFKRMDRKRKIEKPDIFLLCYALLFLGANLLRIFDSVYEGDELFSVLLIKNSVSEICKGTANDVHPPLHYLWLHLFYLLFGDSGWAYHLASYLPYALTILICLTLVKSRFGRIPAVITITLASLTANAVRFNLEIRMYSLAALFCFLSFLFLYEIMLNDCLRNYALFVLFSIGAAYTHYYAIITVFFYYLALLIWTYWQYHRLNRKLFLTYLVTIILYLPWLTVLFSTLMRSVGGWWSQYIASAAECCWFIFTNYKLLYLFLFFLALFLLYSFHVLSVSPSHRPHLSSPRFHLTPLLILVAAGIAGMVGTLAVGVILSHLVRPLFYTRYAYGATTALFLVFGICVSRMHFRKGWCILLTLYIFSQTLGAFVVTIQDERAAFSSQQWYLSKIEVGSHYLIYNPGWPMQQFVQQYFPDAKGIAVDGSASEIIEQLSALHESGYLLLNKDLSDADIASISEDGYTVYFIFNAPFCYTMKYAYYVEYTE